MYLEIQRTVRTRFVETVTKLYGIQIDEPVLGFPPSPDLGEISITSCFELAKRLRQPPRKIAQQIADQILPIEGVARVNVAGAGFINLFLDRAAVLDNLLSERASRQSGPELAEHAKTLVEHTSINPNKAAHIGHLRNAVLGDTLARLLRYEGREVEVQNYIDDTGVQVADVVVGFVHLEKMPLAEVGRLAGTSNPRFDYYCWDLYARVFQHYESEPSSLELRKQALAAIEEGLGELAEMAAVISTAIVRLHLDTMRRMDIRYDVLVEESEILRLEFWKYAFERMKQAGAIYLEENGKNRGCWVMRLADSNPVEDAPGGEEDVKVIVRSNGTVTYVGKDIAYHLWKFGLLGRDFEYRRFYRYPGGHEVWRTARGEDPGAPSFGRAASAYAVIDTRQSYLQDVVRRAFLALGYREQAEHLHHFSYEVVGLSPRCAAEMGVALADDDQRKGYIEVSGRKGLGIKADDLLDRLIAEALREVRSREMNATEAEQLNVARIISVGALRYFLLKYTRRTIIAFDFQEALAFEGETGPYLQYTAVRARNIFRKFAESGRDFKAARALEKSVRSRFEGYLSGESGGDFWELVLLSSQLEMAAEQAAAAEEPSLLAKYAFRLAQAFNNFYHHHHILHEPDASLQEFLLVLVGVMSQSLHTALELLGIETPERM